MGLEQTDELAPMCVQVAASAASWDEAVEIAGGLLKEEGACTDEYIKAMVDAVVELGPYMVVAPGIAMPHARPERGVLKPAISVVTLTTPVVFGNPANDPVDLVIAFTALNKEAHLKSLHRITALLMDESRLRRVRAATTNAELQAAVSDTTTSN